MLVRNTGSSLAFRGSKQHVLENQRITLLCVFSDSYDIARKVLRKVSPSGLGWFLSDPCVF